MLTLGLVFGSSAPSGTAAGPPATGQPPSPSPGSHGRVMPAATTLEVCGKQGRGCLEAIFKAKKTHNLLLTVLT